MYFLIAASFLNVTVIAGDRLLAVSLHLRYQELVTARHLTTVWIISCVFPILYILFPKEIEMVTAIISLIGYALTTVAYVRIYKVVKCYQNQIYSHILFPKEIEMVTAIISLIGYALTTVAYVRIYKVVKCYQNQIYSQNQLQNAQKREAHRQRKSAYNSLFVSVVFLACYFPSFPCTILYETNTSEISFPRRSSCVGFLNLPEFIIKSYCFLLAVPRDSPKCKKHSEEITSHEREHDMRNGLKLRIV